MAFMSENALPRALEAGGHRDPVRQSGNHRAALDGRARGRDRAALPCSGCRRRACSRWPTATPRPRARSPSPICMSRPASATPWGCCTTRRNPARRSWSPPASTTRASISASRSCGPICPRSPGRWSNGRPRCAGSPTLPRAVHRAVKTALAPPTGPGVLSLPADVLNAEGEIELGAPTRVAPPAARRTARRSSKPPI